MLPAQLPGLTENIAVRSIVGRFLEHSRIFYFCIDNKDSIYLSSADWMSRNMHRRIEVAWPVTDAGLKQKIVDECLVPYLHDSKDAWVLSADGTYSRFAAQENTAQHSAQSALMQRYATGIVTARL